MELASIGDRIECDVQNPKKGTISVRLNTPESCALGNDLLMDETSGWRLSEGSKTVKLSTGN